MSRKVKSEDAIMWAGKARKLLDGLNRTVNTPDGYVPRSVLAGERLRIQAEYVLGSGGGRGNTHSDPTASAALNDDAKETAAKIEADRMELIDSIKSAVFDLERSEKLTSLALITEHHAPNNIQGCRQCGAVKGDDGQVHPSSFQPIANKALQLCEWCHRFEFGHGRARPGYGEAPHPQLLRWHLDHLGDQAPLRTVRDLHPEAFAAREEAKRNVETELPACGSKLWHDGDTLTCYRAAGHNGDHAAVDGQGTRVPWSGSTVAA